MRSRSRASSSHDWGEPEIEDAPEGDLTTDSGLSALYEERRRRTKNRIQEMLANGRGGSESEGEWDCIPRQSLDAQRPSPPASGSVSTAAADASSRRRPAPVGPKIESHAPAVPERSATAAAPVETADEPSHTSERRIRRSVYADMRRQRSSQIARSKQSVVSMTPTQVAPSNCVATHMAAEEHKENRTDAVAKPVAPVAALTGTFEEAPMTNSSAAFSPAQRLRRSAYTDMRRQRSSPPIIMDEGAVAVGTTTVRSLREEPHDSLSAPTAAKEFGTQDEAAVASRRSVRSQPCIEAAGGSEPTSESLVCTPKASLPSALQDEHGMTSSMPLQKPSQNKILPLLEVAISDTDVATSSAVPQSAPAICAPPTAHSEEHLKSVERRLLEFEARVDLQLNAVRELVSARVEAAEENVVARLTQRLQLLLTNVATTSYMLDARMKPLDEPEQECDSGDAPSRRPSSSREFPLRDESEGLAELADSRTRLEAIGSIARRVVASLAPTPSAAEPANAVAAESRGVEQIANAGKAWSGGAGAATRRVDLGHSVAASRGPPNAVRYDGVPCDINPSPARGPEEACVLQHGAAHDGSDVLESDMAILRHVGFRAANVLSTSSSIGGVGDDESYAVVETTVVGARASTDACAVSGQHAVAQALEDEPASPQFGNRSARQRKLTHPSMSQPDVITTSKETRRHRSSIPSYSPSQSLPGSGDMDQWTGRGGPRPRGNFATLNTTDADPGPMERTRTWHAEPRQQSTTMRKTASSGRVAPWPHAGSRGQRASLDVQCKRKDATASGATASTAGRLVF